jgi:hypothetical protein
MWRYQARGRRGGGLHCRDPAKRRCRSPSVWRIKAAAAWAGTRLRGFARAQPARGSASINGFLTGHTSLDGLLHLFERAYLYLTYTLA